MKMKHLKLMALAAILMPMLFSCSGSSDTPLFGSLPDVHAQFQAEQDKLKEEAKNINSEADKAKFIEKSEKMKEKWSAKIEDSAKGLNGKPIEFAESNFKVTEPISLEFESFFSQSDMTPNFIIKGGAEVTTDYTLDSEYVPAYATVYIVGYDAEDNQVFTTQCGTVAVEDVEGKGVVKASTPIKLDHVHFNPNNVEAYTAAKTLKLEILK